MAFGFSPKHVAYFPINETSPKEFLITALEAAKRCNWETGPISATAFFAYTKMSMASYGEEVSVVLDNGIATIKSECTGNQMADWGRNKKNVERFIEAYDALKGAITSVEINEKYEALQLPAQEADASGGSLMATKEDSGNLFSLFIPRQNFFITPLILDINIAVFILMAVTGVSIMAPDSASLIKWGANYGPVTLDGEWWRLITCCFVHIGIIHLLFNMYALLYIGVLLEPLLGKLRFAAAYLLTGIAASVASLWWHKDVTVSAGASGAIFGLYGVFFAMLTTNLIEKSARKQLLTSISIFIGYNLINGLKGGIDNAAHIGGLLSGFVAGYIFYPSLKNPEREKLQLASVGVLAVMVAVLSFFVYQKAPNDIGKYDSGIRTFAAIESEALALYNTLDNLPKQKQLAEIKNKGIANWQKCTQLITELDKLDVPQQMHQRNKAILRYCDLRNKSCELVYKAIDENTDKYITQIEEYNKQIEYTLASMNVK